MELTLTANRAGKLRGFLVRELRLSGGLVNRLKWTEAVRVNGQRRFMDYPVAPGDVITVDLREPPPEYPAQDGPLTVLYEDDWLLAVDKPAGMLIHPSRARNEGTLANFVAGYYRRTGQQSAFHPMTRLDRDTFGVVLLAKSAHVHALLQEQRARKTYHALVYGRPQAEEGIIDAPIARLPLPSLLRTVSPEGKPSRTEYRVLANRGPVTALALRPVTGRTHQLRLHCAYMGFPIVGDPQYGTPESWAYSQANGWQTQLLCAKRIRLTHPMTGEPLEVESQMDIPMV